MNCIFNFTIPVFWRILRAIVLRRRFVVITLYNLRIKTERVIPINFFSLDLYRRCVLFGSNSRLNFHQERRGGEGRKFKVRTINQEYRQDRLIHRRTIFSDTRFFVTDDEISDIFLKTDSNSLRELYENSIIGPEQIFLTMDEKI